MYLINTRWFRLSVFRRKLIIDVAYGKVTRKWMTGITLYYKPSPTGNPLYLARKEFFWEVKAKKRGYLIGALIGIGVFVAALGWWWMVVFAISYGD